MQEPNTESDIYFFYNYSSIKGIYTGGLIPIVCPHCRYAFDDFMFHQYSRYGCIGARHCPSCGGTITMQDDDGRLTGKIRYYYTWQQEGRYHESMCEGGVIDVDFSAVYMVTGFFLKGLKEICGFDILEQSGRDEKTKHNVYKLSEVLSSLRQTVDTSNHVPYGHYTTFFPKLPPIACEWRNAVINIVNGKLKVFDHQPPFRYLRGP